MIISDLQHIESASEVKVNGGSGYCPPPVYCKPVYCKPVEYKPVCKPICYKPSYNEC